MNKYYSEGGSHFRNKKINNDDGNSPLAIHCLVNTGKTIDNNSILIDKTTNNKLQVPTAWIRDNSYRRIYGKLLLAERDLMRMINER